ncbi:MAG: ATP-dependent DNA helicase RecG [Proteobacteria bacterium]|nr:ATP-dependent DNA helicase RecG [Pseudomonadota bacterium]
MLKIDTSVKYVKGVGPRVSQILSRINIKTVEDLLFHIPVRYVDQTNIKKIKDITIGEQATFVGTILDTSFRRTVRGKTIAEFLFSDGTGNIKLLFFNQPYLKNTLKRGTHLIIFGKIDFFKSYQMIQPEFDILDRQKGDLKENFGGIIPVYPLTEGISQKYLRKIVRNAIDNTDLSPYNILDEKILKDCSTMQLRDAIMSVHAPKSIKEGFQAKKIIAFYEFLFIQTYLERKKIKTKAEKGVYIKQNDFVKNFTANLPFKLTGAQKNVSEEILKDMQTGRKMARLLQGDVGSGKTIVALISALNVVKNGYQVAFMAPTEILANQHYKKITGYLQDSDITVELLTGGIKASQKKEIKEKLASGEVNIIIGTHALIEDNVVFKSLGLAIIDEQHRFGVEQRSKLLNKGSNTHLLVMTATPIPRSLAMTLYGDLDISVIDELPPGRKEIVTRWIKDDKRFELYDFIKRRITEMRDQVYAIYPLVEESDKLDLKSATRMFEEIKKYFTDIEVGLIHGRINSAEKEEIMRRFAKGEIKILVGTTVIEVGIDVPNATIMVIEHPERFGLSQLHQLRGRIGRGDKKSFCILITDRYISDVAIKRLKTMERTRNGFEIAEEDLRLRGPGNIYGTRQHGLPDFKVANIVKDGDTLMKARECAKKIIDYDKDLEYNKLMDRFEDIDRYYRIG